jgi:hypothetical protein
MPHPQEDVRIGNSAAARKGPTIDYNKQRLEKLISDSNRRRTRYQRGLETAINGFSQADNSVGAAGNGGFMSGLEESKLPDGLLSNRSKDVTNYHVSMVNNNKSTTRKS